ncbi:hypothetical protein CH330_06595 [candidate division WOR-3 bacterium JGI_Cruoil_03_51_56]|uniref:PTS EIIA type-4 domain-containing protein n=1 Tax=candidate division WOR-3 bacterium JGI_Cruoil_03_51_56 TaxID=1973747 RepID=A0A235BRJ6_UNCW3|nr:MAG: hypothetical protein CH330_06595 [candidate division WOR-3 bacterium JGI_Cruoil_03_51_56]
MTKNKNSRPILGIIVGHGGLPRAFQEVAASIVGHSHGIVIVSNENLSAAEMESRLDKIVEEHPKSDILMFIDLYGSGCAHIGAKVRRRHPGNIAVIYGTNLPMLIRFLYYRDRLNLTELAELMQRTGTEEIRLGPS